MTSVHLRNGDVLKVVNEYSMIEKFIHSDTGTAILLTNYNDSNVQYLIRKEAIDYVTTKNNG